MPARVKEEVVQMIEEKDLLELVEKTRSLIREEGLEETIQKFPQSILTIRLSLGKSQKGFTKLLGGFLTQPILIKHEKGETKWMTKPLAKKVSEILTKEKFHLDLSKIIRAFRKFKGMQKGHLTSEEARQLQKIWMRKTTKEQRKLWGKAGAEVATKKARATFLESKISELLEKLKISFKIHEPLKIDDKLTLSVDFLVEEKVIIEVTEKQHGLTMHAQALAFRAMQIKQKHPKLITVCIVPEKMTPMGTEVLKRTFDKVFSITTLSDFEDFLQSITSST